MTGMGSGSSPDAQIAARGDGKPVPVESLLDEDDFAVIAEENLGSPSDASDAAKRQESAEILDACCGGRHWWWDKEHPLAVYMDKRRAANGSIPYRPNWHCDPDLIGDFRAMPFEDETFQLVVFDPPHLVREDPTKTLRGVTGTKYGVLEAATMEEDLHRGFAECWRVLRPGGTLIFKWAGALERVERHFPAYPIVGTRTKKHTRFFVFYKPTGAALIGAAKTQQRIAV